MDRIPIQPEHARPALFPGAPVWSLAGRQDWGATPLGPVESWPQSLKTAASMVLGSTVPMFVAWGPELLLVYNDAYAEILGDRGPAFGRPVREIWSDAWERIRPNAERAWAGETLFFESEPRTLRRDGIEQPIWLTFGYNPDPRRGRRRRRRCSARSPRSAATRRPKAGSARARSDSG